METAPLRTHEYYEKSVYNDQHIPNTENILLLVLMSIETSEYPEKSEEL